MSAIINVKVEDNYIKRMLLIYPKEALRAAEVSLDRTAKDIRIRERQEMLSVFDLPTRFTLNSLQVTPTKNHNMQASVWFKEPDRMSKHYLIPQVEGGEREQKGFERSFGSKFIPGHAATMTTQGNVQAGQIRQILSVLGRAERAKGYQANLTAKSTRRNKKPRDYIYLPKGSARGTLPPGIYQRYTKERKAFTDQELKSVGARNHKAYQKGRTRGKFSRLIRARGLKPILLVGRENTPVKPLFKFYEIASQVHKQNFRRHFDRELNRRLPK